ncbi:MAG TPA: glycoside hydrolase family 15 protein [Pseudolabrys sp.]|jgi:GH15 family glucan-1,4-alpha-glucosidase|nr:glycoside hydrolase family 15 protein [Pseudolabrys sp.]
MTDYGLDLAVIGNGRTAALLEPSSRIVWWCLPRYDGDPVFCRLLSGGDDKGFTDVVLEGQAVVRSNYVRNTAIVVTELIDDKGAGVRITDFAPRFQIYGRTFRPPQIIRIIEPIGGMPRIIIRFRTTHRYGEPVASRSSGSNHIRYWRDDVPVRLTTDAPLSYVENEASFILTRPVHMVFGTDEPFEGSLETTCRDFCERTRDYWLEWVRRLAFSIDWQDEIIRAGITLKLCSYEETGAIVAALTTSIPEVPKSGRNWDYRFCWMRDAFFVVRALNRIGATRTMEDFISYILSVSAGRLDEVRPLYGVVHTDSLEERTAPALSGYGGDGPVRIGNAAVNQSQHDVYGSIIMAATPIFFDRRLPRPGDASLFHTIEPLGEHAAKLALKPDAGIWEYRGRMRVHTHSAAMCWAGCQRLAAIANHLDLPERANHWAGIAERIGEEVLKRAWSPKRKAFSAAFESEDLDASALLLAELGLVSPEDPRFIATVEAIGLELRRGFHVMRYVAADDFGLPESAFLICRFWLVDALWEIGRRDEARDMFVDALRMRNRYGLLSEDVHPVTGKLWGNFPQTYSMSGLILTAIKLSRSWGDRYWRGSS